MNKDNIIIMEEIQSLFAKELELELNNFDNLEIQSFCNNSIVEILFKMNNLQSEKKMCIKYSLGINSLGIKNSITNVFISNSENKILDIGEYSKKINGRDIMLYSNYETIETEKVKLTTFLNTLKCFLNDKKIRDLLYTDFWVTLPMNWKPYK